MSQKNWACFVIHTESLDRLNGLNRDVVELMKKLRENKHLERFFFNRYAIGKKNEYFIKLGLVNGDKEAQSELNNLLEKHSVPKPVPYECEMWKVDGIPIDEIKCMSCELFEKIRVNFKEKPTQDQIAYLLHFLVNQLGLGYEDELDLHKRMEKIIKKRLEEIRKDG